MKKLIALTILVLAAAAAQSVGRGTQEEPGGPSVPPAWSDIQDQKAQTEKKPEKTPQYTKEQIMKVQKILQLYEYYEGPIDGKMSPALQQAIKDFQEDEDLKPTGELDKETFKRILELDEVEGEDEPDEPAPPASWR